MSALIREGYAVCAANAVGAAPVVAYDSADVEAGWQVPVTICAAKRPEHTSALYHSKNDLATWNCSNVSPT